MLETRPRISVPAGTRMRAVDAARGSAMLFVFLSHFGGEYFRDGKNPLTAEAIQLISMVATPTFMIISGMMLGYLSCVKRERFGSLRWKFADRGLFFLVVGHGLIAIAYLPRQGSLPSALRAVFITDVIGVSLIVVPPLLLRMRATARIVAGVVGYVLCWTVILSWVPRSGMGIAAKHVFFGILDGREAGVLWYSFSILPWLSLYLTFTVAGERLAMYAENPGALRKFVSRMAGLSLGTALALTLTRRLGERYVYSAGSINSKSWFTIYQKTPPGPVYVLFYGGIGLAILFALIQGEDVPWLTGFLDFTKELGQASFFSFIAQYYLFEFVLYMWHPVPSPLWPLYLVGFTAILAWAARQWNRTGWNRFLSFRSVFGG